VTVTSTPATSGFDEQMTVMSFKGAGGPAPPRRTRRERPPTVSGGLAAGSRPTRPATTGTGPPAARWGPARPWCRWIDSGSGDTYWTQGTTAPPRVRARR
jgi:hypothetical protein